MNIKKKQIIHIGECLCLVRLPLTFFINSRYTTCNVTVYSMCLFKANNLKVTRLFLITELFLFSFLTKCTFLCHCLNKIANLTLILLVFFQLKNVWFSELVLWSSLYDLLLLLFIRKVGRLGVYMKWCQVYSIIEPAERSKIFHISIWRYPKKNQFTSHILCNEIHSCINWNSLAFQQVKQNLNISKLKVIIFIYIDLLNIWIEMANYLLCIFSSMFSIICVVCLFIVVVVWHSSQK